MSVSAISSVYSSYQTYLYQYFGSSISESRFETLMQKFGITESGDADKDVQALYSAMYNSADTEAAGSVAYQNSQAVNSSQETDAQNASNVPWASLMSQVGLAATGDLSADYQSFDTKISQMQASAASSPQQQAYVSQLTAQAAVVFVDNNSNQQATQSQAQAQVSGADIVAKLNQLLMLA